MAVLFKIILPVSDKSLNIPKGKWYRIWVQLWKCFHFGCVINTFFLVLIYTASPLILRKNQIDGGFYFLKVFFPGVESTWCGLLTRIGLNVILSYHWLVVDILMSEVLIEVAWFHNQILGQLWNHGNTESRRIIASTRILLQQANAVLDFAVPVALGSVSVIFICTMSTSIKLTKESGHAATAMVCAITALLEASIAGILVGYAAKIGDYDSKIKMIVEKNGRDKKHLRRVVKATRAEKVKCGNFGVFGKTAVLEMYHIWIDQTITFMLFK